MSRKPFWFNKESFESEIRAFLTSLSLDASEPEKYQTAFLHRSILNELDFEESNERLEFLGDAVLELAVTEVLFAEFPDKPEGELTDLRSALVRGKNLAGISAKLGFGSMVLLSKGETIAWGNENPYILANTFEAFIGALQLHKGFEAASGFIREHVISTLPEILAASLHVDPKSHLQEVCQAIFSRAPEYIVVSETGLDHEKNYIVSVRVEGREIGIGEGSSKKKAQSAAAEAALLKQNIWGSQNPA